MNVRLMILVPVMLLLLCSPALADSYGTYFPCFPCYGDQQKDTFGDAFRMARDSQILNPDAASNLDPVVGLEGQAAKKVHDNYIDGFGKKQGSGGRGGTVGFVPLLTGGLGQ